MNDGPAPKGAGPQFVEKVHPLPRGEGGPEGVGRGMRAESQKPGAFKGLLKSWFWTKTPISIWVFFVQSSRPISSSVSLRSTASPRGKPLGAAAPEGLSTVCGPAPEGMGPFSVIFCGRCRAGGCYGPAVPVFRRWPGGTGPRLQILHPVDRSHPGPRPAPGCRPWRRWSDARRGIP